jgi:hypothetical protein
VVQAVAGLAEPPYSRIDEAINLHWGTSAAVTAIRILRALPASASASRLVEFAARKPSEKPSVYWQGYLPDRAMRAAIRATNEEERAGVQRAETEKIQALTSDLFTAPRRERRAEAAEQLADLEDLRVLPALRRAWHADPSPVVKRSAARAMTSLGDTALVEEWIEVLDRRDQDEDLAKIAAYGLGGLAESRGIAALVEALVVGWRPHVIAEIAPTAGAGFVSTIVDRVMAEPKVASQRAIVLALEHWGDVARPLIFEEFSGLRDTPDDVRRARALLRLAECRPGLWRDLGGTILAWCETQARPNEPLMRAAQKALDATGDAYGPPRIGG